MKYFLDAIVEMKFLGNSMAQWLGLLGVILGGFIVGKIFSFILMRQSKKLTTANKMPLTAMFFKSISGPVTLLFLAGGLYIASTFMTLKFAAPDGKSYSILPFWINVCRTIAAMAAGWFIFRMVDVLEFFLKKWTSKTETTLDDQLVPLIRKTLRVFVVIVAALFIAQNIFNWDIGALVAGLGLGGLAFALASKDMLANLFGSITIFADRPFYMGQRVKIRDYNGTIEEVGFRSTRIRLLNGNLVTIPNSVVANEPVENIGVRPYIKRTLNVTVTYDTAPEKLGRAVDIIREMLDSRKDRFHRDNPPRVFFSDFNAESLNIVVYYWFAPPEWWDYLEFNHDFNMELLQRFNEEEIEFAFPTQTIYVKKDAATAIAANPPKPQGGETYT